MSKGIPAFVVEGHLEHKFLNDVCGNKSRVLKLSNGKNVSPAAIARQVYAQVSVLSVEPSYIVVIADREKRGQSAIDIETEVSAILQKTGLKIPFSVHVPDMMIENWILADAEVLQNEGLTVELTAGTEGCHGKSKLDAAFRRKARNIAYKETIDGVRLLKACRASTISAHSPSFNRLKCAISARFMQCYWIQR